MTLKIDYTSLPKDSLILVTGANGFLGSHICSFLLYAGHRVRGSVRNPSRCAWLQQLFDAAHGPGRFSLVRVPDMAAPDAFDEAVKGVAGVCHVASITGDLTPDPNAVIPVVIAGTLSALEAAGKEESVKSFVYTSSIMAAYMPKANASGNVGQETWNEEAVRQAWTPPPYEQERTMTVYAASKTEAEKAIWTWVRERKPGFRVNTVLPNIILGRSLDPKNQGHPTTSGYLVDLATGKFEEHMWTVFPPQYWVDVEDTALIHVAALTRSDLDRQRLFAFATQFNWNTALQALRKIYPEKTFPEDREGLGYDYSNLLEASTVQQILKGIADRGSKSLEECLRENLEGIDW